MRFLGLLASMATGMLVGIAVHWNYRSLMHYQGKLVEQEKNSDRNVSLPLLLREQKPYLKINDNTVQLSPSVLHPWIHQNRLKHNNSLRVPSRRMPPPPPFKVIITDYGWNHPDASIGLSKTRSLRQREVYQATVDHPYFDPAIQWRDIKSQAQVLDPNITYYIFLDIETCFESNYPSYVADYPPNADQKEGRAVQDKGKSECYFFGGCRYFKDVLDTLQDKYPAVDATLVVMDCHGNGPGEYRKRVNSRRLSIAAYSFHETQMLPDIDLGFPPPAINPSVLNPQQEEAIMNVDDKRTCQYHPHDYGNGTDATIHDRPYFFSFIGSQRPASPARSEMIDVYSKHTSTSEKILVMTAQEFRTMHLQQQSQNRSTLPPYDQVLMKSIFSATPRGDNLFSYRFTEVLSAGAIPVVHANDWVLPFSRELVDWERECAVVIKEEWAKETLNILKSIGTDEICQRQQRCYEIYTKYMKNASGNLEGILMSLELKRKKRLKSQHKMIQ